MSPALIIPTKGSIPILSPLRKLSPRRVPDRLQVPSKTWRFIPTKFGLAGETDVLMLVDETGSVHGQHRQLWQPVLNLEVREDFLGEVAPELHL